MLHVLGMSAVLTEDTAHADPYAQFSAWFEEAKQHNLPEPNAMALATATRDGAPSVRMVLLKEVDDRGFVFYTNYSSRKARELEHNARAALLFFWQPLARQVRVEGSVARVTPGESADYFRTRPRASQIGAWASVQSEPVTRDQLERRVAELEEEYAGREVPVPPFWGGFRVTPARFEFWQGREHRLHDRLVYARDGARWRIERLSP
jgi:pyridoxamine 5'-phosphate oxidase